MTQRSYTVSEIDDLRRAMEDKWLWSISVPGEGGAWEPRAFTDEELVVAVEEMTRTHMLAGHTAHDIRAAMI